MQLSLAWLLVLVLRTSLGETAGEKPPEGFRYVSYEVTIPKKLIPRYGQEPQDVNYLLQIEGKGHVVHLRQKRGFFPKHFPIFTYSKEGDLQADYPFIRDDCFYHGFVQDKPLSSAALSTCSGGLRGLLRLNNKSYEIQPVQPSATFQHVVYQLEEKEGAVGMRCGLTEEERSHLKTLIKNKEHVARKIDRGGDWWAHTRYVKVAIVVDHERYVQFGKNESLVAMQVMDIVHLANLFYEPLNVLVTIAGLEIWSEKNLIATSGAMGEILEHFRRWRRRTLVQHVENDVGHLFVYKDFGAIVGLAFGGTICDMHWASSVQAYTTTSFLHVTITFAHELGHILGMPHDNEHCTCEQRACIMSSFLVDTNKFSSCSYQYYFELRNSPCLLIPLDPDKVYKGKFCGNKVVDKGEQCDAGAKPHCEWDPCCQSNCMLRSHATCAFGLCCAKCKYLPAGTVCRENISICDLPEYCNGTSEQCPEDVYVQDGAACKDGAYCYHGNCSTHNEQCQIIFGKTARVASEDCFRKINVQGDRFGNCGFRHGIYKKCNGTNILCGRIQCENVDKLPSLEEHNTIIQTPIGNRQCWGTDYHTGIKTADIGAVRDGTPCGIDMMCIKGECVGVSLLKYDCNVTKCHHRGICNTHKHCHCNYGWAPPDCLNEGYGGSIDSGPLSPRTSGIRAVTIVGIVLPLSVIFCTGLGVYCRSRVRHQLRRLSGRFYSTGWKQEGSPL